MDTLGALALGTEAPTQDLLERRPYKRNASLISLPMRRNILFQSSYQLILLLVLLFRGAEWFGVKPMGQDVNCFKYTNNYASFNVGPTWDLNTLTTTNDISLADVSCSTFTQLCPNLDSACYESQNQFITQANATYATQFSFLDLGGFEDDCLKCQVRDYTHGTIIFNAFIFCQVSNFIFLNLLLIIAFVFFLFFSYSAFFSYAVRLY